MTEKCTCRHCQREQQRPITGVQSAMCVFHSACVDVYQRNSRDPSLMCKFAMCVFHSACVGVGVCVKGNNRDPLLMCSLLCVSFTVCVLVRVSKGSIEISHWCAVYYAFHSVCVKGNNRDLSLMCSLLCTSFVHECGSVPNTVILYVVPVDVKPHSHPQSANVGFQLSHSPWFKFFRQLIKEGPVSYTHLTLPTTWTV